MGHKLAAAAAIQVPARCGRPPAKALHERQPPQVLYWPCMQCRGTLYRTAGWVHKEGKQRLACINCRPPASAADLRFHLSSLGLCRSIQCHAGAPLWWHF